MQIQPDNLKRSEAKRARQASRASDDVFRGGGPAATAPGAGRLTSPWHMGAGRLWETARRRRDER